MKRVLLVSPTGNVGEKLANILELCDFELYYISRGMCTLEDDIEIDACIYSAGITSARKLSTEKYVEDNCLMAKKVKDICLSHNAKRIIYLSSDEIYGALFTDCLTVDSDRINMNVYAMTKFLSEKIIIESHIPYYILRLPGIVGGDHSGNSFLERMVRDLRNNRAVSYTNPYKFFNNVVHIDDLCEFIIKLLYIEEKGSEIMHLGQPESVRLIDIVTYVKDKLNSKSIIDFQKSGVGRYFTLPIEMAKKRGFAGRGVYNILDEIMQVDNFGGLNEN